MGHISDRSQSANISDVVVINIVYAELWGGLYHDLFRKAVCSYQTAFLNAWPFWVM